MKLTVISLAIAVVLGMLLGAVMGFSPKDQVKCVNVYYDDSNHLESIRGRHLVGELKKLLQSYPQFAVQVSAVNEYQSGDIEQCVASIYLGSAYENQLPAAFINDFIEAKKNVAWLGYNIWQLGASLEEIFGFRYVGNVYVRPYAQVELVQSLAGKSSVLAEAKHPASREVLPYILQSQNHYYVADVPLDYGPDSTRFRAFTDVLGDILRTQHNREKRLGKRHVRLVWEDLMKVEL
jgi:Uncharacterized protein conserved in bacteria